MMMVRRIALAVGLMLLGRVALSAAPLPEIINGAVYNFWQDADHVRGIWRTTTIADYVSATPSWTTVLDLDALASTEKKNWVWEGADCDSPSTTRCLIFLSDGGADATTVREFDLTTERFVDDGFVLPNGKQNVAWADENTLLVAREWTPGDLTRSSYPYIVKRVTRGQPLTEAADVFAGTKDDVRAGPFELRDGSGHRVLFIDEGTSFFDHRSFVVTSAGVEPIAMPAKAHIAGLVAGQVLITLDEPWRLGTKVIPSGSLASVDLAALLADPQHLQPVAVYVPGPRESLATLATTRGQVLITLLDNVRGRAAIYTPVGGGWSHRALPLPDDVALDLVSANEDGADVMLTVSGFLTPTTLYRVDADAGTASAIKALPARFDASHDVVEQREAISKDGTHIPYFLVRPKSMRFDGTTPTILDAYGGFGVSSTPYYSGTRGKLWLARGGAYVLANIRGGGEFGPAWHDAGLKTHRQVICDDFAAVGRDLIAHRITSPRHLGIVGGSNGGLLMGVEFEQHPDLWNAVQIEVPLLDMLRYEQIEAGASWVGEYGSVSVPAERAFLAKISPYANIKRGVRYPR
jgi:prolyl oligopeptidase